MAFADSTDTISNSPNEGETSNDIFYQDLELSDNSDNESVLEEDEHYALRNEQDWQLNVVVKFNINPVKVLNFRVDSKSNRMTVTETPDGLQLLKGLAILDIDEQEVEDLDPVSLKEMWSTHDLPVIVKFGTEKIDKLEPVSLSRISLQSSCEDHVMFLGETSSIDFEYEDQKKEDIDYMDVIPEEQCIYDESSNKLLALQPISFDGTQGDQSSWSHKCKQRARIITELLDTEKSYIRGLEELNNVFLKRFMIPLKKSVNVDISSFQIKVENLISLHDEIYHKFCSSENICTVFQEEFRFLRMYKPYITDYKEAYSKLLKASKKRGFKGIFNNGQSLSYDPLGFFHIHGITLVQRPPRYVLLLKELKKYTPVRHPMYKDLEKGLVDIEEICDDINEYQGQLENELKFVKFSTEVDLKTLKSHGIKELVVPARRLIRVGKVAINKIRSSSVFRRRSRLSDASLVFELGSILMCNDILIVMHGKKNRVVRVFLLSEVEAELNNEPIKPPNNDQKYEKVFEVVIRKRSDKRKRANTVRDKERVGFVKRSRKELRSVQLSSYFESFYKQDHFSIYLCTLEEAEQWETTILKYARLASID